MRSVAAAELLRSPAKTLLRALAVGGALSLTLLFEGFRLGIDRQMAAPAGALPASLIVAEKGARHFIGVRSSLPQAARAAVEAVPGVVAAHPLLTVPVIFLDGERRTPLQLVVYDTSGAPRLRRGAAIDGPRQVVFDARLAELHGLAIGDRVRLLDRDLQLVGVSTDSDVSFAPLAYITYDELLDLYLASDLPGALGGAPLLSFLLVDLQPGASLPAVRRAIVERLPGVDVHTPAELSNLDVELGRQLFGPVVNLLVAVSWAAGVLVVTLIMAAAVVDRRRELGVLKALGADLRWLARSLVTEAALIVTIAFPVALLLARVAAAAIEGYQPLYRVVPWQPAVALVGMVAAGAAVVLGALAPLPSVARVEPDSVFRS